MTSVEDEETGEVDDEFVNNYIEAITEEFAQSPEFLEFSEDPRVQYLHIYLDNAARYIGETVGTMTLGSWPFTTNILQVDKIRRVTE